MSANRPSSTAKVGFVSLGCPKALVDSERILTQLRLDGYEVTPNYDDAGVVIVNTCGFIDSAKAESLAAMGRPSRRTAAFWLRAAWAKGTMPSASSLNTQKFLV